MEDLFLHVDRKLDAIAADLGEVKGDLREHIRRTELLEVATASLRAGLSPVQTHVAVMGALAKGIGLLGVVVAIISGVAKLLGAF
jgi:hypothetical protein